MTPISPTVVIEICGEGKTDVAKRDATPVPADAGVVTVLVRRLCDDPPALLVKRTPLMFLQGKGKGMRQKVLFFKRNAQINGAAGCVFVLDTEGNPAVVWADLDGGRNGGPPNYPMAVGMAHPCIEAWMLSDASAVRRGLGLNQRPAVPPQPETLPAPQANRTNNPKTALLACHPNNRHPNLAEKTAIAEYLTLDTAGQICPSFAAFATEVRERIRDRLFPPPPAPPAPDASADDTDPPAE